MAWRRVFRWLVGLDDEYRGVVRGLQQRVDELIDDIAHLERRYTKLQGRMTGGIRYEYDEEGDQDDGDESPARRFLTRGG